MTKKTDIEQLAEFVVTENTWSQSDLSGIIVSCKQCGKSSESKHGGYKINHTTDCIVEIAEEHLPYE